MSQQTQPNVINCLASGRYLYLVLRVKGTRVAPFSICEMEVTPKAGKRYRKKELTGADWDGPRDANSRQHVEPAAARPLGRHKRKT